MSSNFSDVVFHFRSVRYSMGEQINQTLGLLVQIAASLFHLLKKVVTRQRKLLRAQRIYRDAK